MDLPASVWCAAASLATTQQVPSLFFHGLKQKQWLSTAPPSVVEDLKNAWRRIALHNLRLLADLRRIKDALDTDGIAFIALKGIHLAAAVYKDPALRQMRDMDLLLKPRQLGPAADTLKGLGFRPRRDFDLNLELAAAKHLPPFVNANGTVVELHAGITYPWAAYAIDAAVLWRRTISFPAAGTSLLGLSHEDLLLHLCLHTAFEHRFQFGLRPFCDMAALIRRRPALDWDFVIREAQARGWQKGVFLALVLAKTLVGAAVPDDVAARLRPSDFDDAVAAVAVKQIFTDKAYAHTIPPAAVRVLTRTGRVDKLRGLLSRVLLPRRDMARMYALPNGSPRVLLYYPVRLLDLFRRHRQMLNDVSHGNPRRMALIRRQQRLADWMGL